MGASEAERRLRAALEGGATATSFWRAIPSDLGPAVDLEFVDGSPGFGEWLGRSLADMRGRRYSELIPTGLHDRLPAYLQVLETGQKAVFTFDRISHEGARATAEVRCVPVGDGDLFIALWDVTEREERIREAERVRGEALVDRDLLAVALNASPDGFAIYRLVRGDDEQPPALLVEFVNEVAAGPTGRAPEEWVGASVAEWFPEVESSGLLNVLLQSIHDKAPRRVVISTQSASGWIGRFENVITPFGPDLLVNEWWAADADTPEGIEAPSSVPTGTRQDPLTGLDNRGEFRRRLAAWLEEQPADVPAGAVIVVDIDNFGRLNDLVGSSRADAALAAFARALRALDPWLVLPARIGADSCAVVVPGDVDAATAELARAHSNRILRDVSDQLSLPPLSVSGGLRIIEPGLSVDDVLRDCDTALRHSVREGGGRLTVFRPEIRADLLADYLVGEDVRAGVARGDFLLAYQPVVGIENGAHLGDEALARWQHPDHGMLMPSRFIPIAEATGTIVRLGAWVLERAVADLAASRHARTVGINVSAVQMLQTDLPAEVARVLERHHVEPGRLVIEITESAILPDSVRLRDHLAELRQMGVLVAIDDFGSGYSSIGYLDWIPVDIVKLDQAFLLGDLDRRRRNLVAATAQLVRSIGARSLAEGIETDEQWDVAREAGVDFGQGYMFGRAVLPIRAVADEADRSA